MALSPFCRDAVASGRVCEVSEPEADRREKDEAEEAWGGLVAAGRRRAERSSAGRSTARSGLRRAQTCPSTVSRMRLLFLAGMKLTPPRVSMPLRMASQS